MEMLLSLDMHNHPIMHEALLHETTRRQTLAETQLWFSQGRNLVIHCAGLCWQCPTIQIVGAPQPYPREGPARAFTIKERTKCFVCFIFLFLMFFYVLIVFLGIKERTK